MKQLETMRVIDRAGQFDALLKTKVLQKYVDRLTQWADYNLADPDSTRAMVDQVAPYISRDARQKIADKIAFDKAIQNETLKDFDALYDHVMSWGIPGVGDKSAFDISIMIGANMRNPIYPTRSIYMFDNSRHVLEFLRMRMGVSVHVECEAGGTRMQADVAGDWEADVKKGLSEKLKDFVKRYGFMALLNILSRLLPQILNELSNFL